MLGLLVGLAGAAEPWPVLQASAQALARHPVVDEARFAGQGWADIEQANAALASVQVDHFEGVPAGG